MIRRDPAAAYERLPSGCNPFGLLYNRRDELVVRFRAGGYVWGGITQERYDAIVALAQTQAVLLVKSDKSRTYWMFQDRFYWEDEGYSAEEVTALILDREDRKKRRVDSAIAKIEMRDDESAQARQIIPDDVKLLVWKRDGG